MLKFDIAQEMYNILEGQKLQKIASVKENPIFNKYAAADKIFEDLLTFSEAFDSVGLTKSAAAFLQAATELDSEIKREAGDVTRMYKAMQILDEEMLKVETDPYYREMALNLAGGSFVKQLCNVLSVQLDKEPEYFLEVVEDYLEGKLKKSDEKMPDDYEACADCGFDHSYEHDQAKSWHEKASGVEDLGFAMDLPNDKDIDEGHIGS